MGGKQGRARESETWRWRGGWALKSIIKEVLWGKDLKSMRKQAVSISGVRKSVPGKGAACAKAQKFERTCNSWKLQGGWYSWSKSDGATWWEIKEEKYSGTMSGKALCFRLVNVDSVLREFRKELPISLCVEGKAVGQAEGSLVPGLLQLLDDDDG